MNCTFASKLSAVGPRRGARPGRLLILSVLAALLCGPAASAWASETDRPPAPSVAESLRTTPAAAGASESSTNESETYASREAASKNLETFKGGEPVVIIGSTTLLIILVVLLILVV